MINNKVYEEDGYRFRVICTGQRNRLYYIGLDGSEKEVPKSRDYPAFVDNLEKGLIHKIKDPYQASRKDDNISDSQRAKGDEYFRVIDSYWKNPILRLQFFDRKGRSELTESIAAELNISVDQAKRTITKFFRRGMNRDSVLPDFNRRGRPQEKGNIKNRSHTGMPVNSAMRENFEKAYKKYRLGKKLTLRESYNYLLSEYYPEALEGFDQNQAPSLDQFLNWIRKNRSKQEEDQRFLPEKEFENNQKILSAYSTRDVFGVGDRFEMDCTKLDIILVSSANPDIVIGKPFLFSIIDVFSSMCCGYVLSFENESWETAGQALYNCIEDKVEFCTNHGIVIEEDDWPARYLPAALLSDNGAVNSRNIEPIVRSYGLAVEYAKPYTAIQKGKSERSHRKFNDWIKRHLPGGILSDPGERGAPDYAAGACLTLEELNQIIILKILEFNKTPISKYPLSADWLAYGIEATPLNLWNWSIKNNGGTLIKVEDREVFRTLVLPHKDRVIHKDGIHLNNLVYSSTSPRILALLYERKGRKVRVFYDIFDIRRVYIELDSTLYPLTLKDPKTFENRMTLHELNILLGQKNERKRSAALRHSSDSLETDRQIAQIVEKARNRNIRPEDTSVDMKERKAEIKRTRIERSKEEQDPPVFRKTKNLASRWDEVRRAAMKAMEENNEF